MADVVGVRMRVGVRVGVRAVTCRWGKGEEGAEREAADKETTRASFYD